MVTRLFVLVSVVLTVVVVVVVNATARSTMRCTDLRAHIEAIKKVFPGQVSCKATIVVAATKSS